MRHIRKLITFSFTICLGTLQGVPQQAVNLDKLDFTTLQQRAVAGDAEAQKALGNRYLLGLGLAKDFSQAFIWYQKSADQGNAFAEYMLGSMYLFGRGTSHDCVSALAWTRKAADQGIVPAQDMLGVLYGGDICGVRDYAQAAVWYGKAASQGNDHAQRWLGDAYEFGKGVPQNLAEAHRLLGLASNQGNEEAKNELAKLDAPRAASSTPQDFAALNKQWDSQWSSFLDLGVDTLQRQTGPLEVAAEYALGYKYRLGRGVAVNNDQAFYWNHKAASQGFALAEAGVSDDYSLGRGVPQDYVQAAAWLRKAADHGLPRAQLQLAFFYTTGWGKVLPQDYTQAVVWYRKLADEGDSSGQVGLGEAYLLGKGVFQDSTEAHRWFQLAATQGNQDAKDELAKLDTPPQSAIPLQAAQTRNDSPVDISAQDDEEEAKKTEIEDKVSDLESDIEELQHEVETNESSVEQLSHCSGIGAAICEAGAAKAQSNANKANNQIDEKRSEIARLKGEEAQETVKRSTNTADIYARNHAPQAGISYSPPPVQTRRTVNSTVTQQYPTSVATNSDKSVDTHTATGGESNLYTDHGVPPPEGSTIPGEKGHWVVTEMNVTCYSNFFPHTLISAVLVNGPGDPNCNGPYVEFTNPDKTHSFYYGFAGVINERMEANSTRDIRWPAPYIYKDRPNPPFVLRVTIKYFEAD